jgi:hypothetical protein
MRAERTPKDLKLRSATVHQLDAFEFDNIIQKGIPIPPRQNGPKQKYLDRLLDCTTIGDSFFLPNISRATAAQACAKRLGMTLTTRKIGNGLRVWRIG